MLKKRKKKQKAINLSVQNIQMSSTEPTDRICSCAGFEFPRKAEAQVGGVQLEECVIQTSGQCNGAFEAGQCERD